MSENGNKNGNEIGNDIADKPSSVKPEVAVEVALEVTPDNKADMPDIMSDTSVSPFETHNVSNQSPDFEDLNFFTTDIPLMEAVKREGGADGAGHLSSMGARLGSSATLELGRLANENPPILKRFDAKGHAFDQVEFHPAYHDLMRMSMRDGLHCSAWDGLLDGKINPGSNVTRAAGLYMTAQSEAGHLCPITMTNAAVATLKGQAGIAETLLPKIFNLTYDPAFKPIPDKQAITIGMGMTEKQGGTDVRANQTRAIAVRASGPGQEYIITGHKWFMSAPMCDAFLILAQTKNGLSCFFVPRILPDNSVNSLRFQRLKDKLGNRSNASTEVELHGCHGWLIGEEGRGVPTIIEMVNYTRLDCAMSSAGLMRLGMASALNHTRHRKVFDRLLVDQPIMTTVLADLALDVEAATALAFRLARAFDEQDDPVGAAWARIMTPITKYWICKTAPAHIYEAMECLGGNGYVEDGLLARAYREAPLNAIWEGSGNVMCLDVLRALQKDPAAMGTLLDDLQDMTSGHNVLQKEFERITDLLYRPMELDGNARMLVEGLARLAAAGLLNAHAPNQVADSFIALRFSANASQTYGASGSLTSANEILDRAFS